jgi:hypothetical protein
MHLSMWPVWFQPGIRHPKKAKPRTQQAAAAAAAAGQPTAAACCQQAIPGPYTMVLLQGVLCALLPLLPQPSGPRNLLLPEGV